MKNQLKINNTLFGIITITGIICTVLFSMIGILFYAFNIILIGFIIGLICLLINGLLIAIIIKKGK